MLEPGSQEDTQSIWKSGWRGASPLNSRFPLKLMERVHRTTSRGIVHTTVQLSAQYTACPAVCDGSAQRAFPRPTPGQALLLYVAQSLSLSPLDIIQTHYQPWGFLNAAHTVCPGLFEELLTHLCEAKAAWNVQCFRRTAGRFQVGSLWEMCLVGIDNV